jgi:hypothetical protein
MHVRELVELGALVAAHGSVFINRPSVLTDRHMEQYWVASRCRYDRWTRVLATWSRSSRQATGAHWTSVRPVIEEILVSELLTRTWAAVAFTHDRTRHVNALSPIVRSVMTGHIEARNRALSVMVHGHGFDVDEGIALNRLRRQTERWTDMMLGYLLREHDVSEFAFSVERARDFASDLRYEDVQGPGDHAWQLTLTGLRSAFENGLSPVSPNADLHQQIAGSILACFHSDMYESSGALKSLWLLRIDQIADNTQGMVNDLLALDEVPATHR